MSTAAAPSVLVNEFVLTISAVPAALLVPHYFTSEVIERRRTSRDTVIEVKTHCPNRSSGFVYLNHGYRGGCLGLPDDVPACTVQAWRVAADACDAAIVGELGGRADALLLPQEIGAVLQHRHLAQLLQDYYHNVWYAGSDRVMSLSGVPGKWNVNAYHFSRGPSRWIRGTRIFTRAA